MGDFFNASELLNFVGFEYFGDIKAGKEGVRLLQIDEPDLVLQLHERTELAQAFSHLTESVQH